MDFFIASTHSGNADANRKLGDWRDKVESLSSIYRALKVSKRTNLLSQGKGLL